MKTIRVVKSKTNLQGAKIIYSFRLNCRKIKKKKNRAVEKCIIFSTQSLEAIINYTYRPMMQPGVIRGLSEKLKEGIEKSGK